MGNIASETRQKEQQSIPQEKQLRQGELPSNEENVRELDFDINDIFSAIFGGAGGICRQIGSKGVSGKSFQLR